LPEKYNDMKKNDEKAIVRPYMNPYLAGILLGLLLFVTIYITGGVALARVEASSL
jgi:hypothetical protein